jgi:peptidoglycan/LPS O-acetylase OafA/YrhL
MVTTLFSRPAAKGEPLSRGRIAWLDGLRGIAAIQVVFLHYTTAFLPGLGGLDPSLMTHGWEMLILSTPLYFVINGYGSVYLFFLMSGVALTHSFARVPLAIWHSALRRLIRLGLPMAAAVLLSYALMRAWPSEHLMASEIIGSTTWLGKIGPSAITFANALRQIFVEAMLAGYQGAGLLPGRIGVLFGQQTILEAFNAPLWTLHLEFYGSLLVIALVALKARLRRRWYHLVCLALALALPKSPLVLFLLGHLAAPLLSRAGVARWHRPAGWYLLAIGIVLSTGQVFAPIRLLFALLPRPVIPGAVDALHFQPMLAAIFIFAGVAMLPAVQRVLTRPLGRFAGRISFSLYLVHFPILFTVVCALFLVLQPVVPYGVAVAACCLAGMALSVVIAVLFERLVDRPAIALSRAV